VQGAGAAHPAGYAQGFVVCGAVLLVAGLVGLATLNPQRTLLRLREADAVGSRARAQTAS
jgi:hypothetical protein